MLSVGLNPFHVLPVEFGQRWLVRRRLPEWNLPQAADEIERGSQFVADGGQEAAFHPVRFFSELLTLNGLSIQPGALERRRQFLDDGGAWFQMRGVERHKPRQLFLQGEREQRQVERLVFSVQTV